MGERRGRSTTAEDNVIRVRFGDGGGRLRSVPQEAVDEQRSVAPDVYGAVEVARLLGLSTSRLRALDRAGVASPTGKRRGRRAYTFGDLIALRVARDLLNGRVRLRDVARAVEALRAALPVSAQPLAALRVQSDGRRVVVRTEAGRYEPLTGQMLLDFETKRLHEDVVRVLRPRVERERAVRAREHYVRAAGLDEDPWTMDEAELHYRKALALDPWLAIAHTNLGNICFRRGDDVRAVECYRKALQIEADQAEAQYNLGYVLLERGELHDAVGYLEGAVRADPRFADAHFNLAMAYEQLGEVGRAHPHWARYLELEPVGAWSDIARRHLGVG